MDVVCRYDHEDTEFGPGTPVRIFLRRDSDQRYYEIFHNPSCEEYNEPFVTDGSMLGMEILCGPQIAIPVSFDLPGYWLGGLTHLTYGDAYWIVAWDEIDDLIGWDMVMIQEELLLVYIK